MDGHTNQACCVLLREAFKDILTQLSPCVLRTSYDSWLTISFSGQHCLDPDAFMLDVYRANPHAEWVIKPKAS